MNTLKLYWSQKREESIATITLVITSSLILLLPAIWYEKPFVAILGWFMFSLGLISHAVMMVLANRQQHKANAKLAANGIARLLVSVLLSLSALRVGAADQPPPVTTIPFEFDLTLATGIPDPDNPQAVIPAAVCVGVVGGILGWIGIKIWSACLDIHIRNITNRAGAEFQAAGAPITATPNTSNPIVGSGCSCDTGADVPPEAAAPLPFLLEHSDGRSWSPISVGMTPGEQHFVPETGTWRITPMRIIATRDSMIVPPGTLEASVDLRTWTTVDVSSSVRNVLPEPNHFYRIR